MLVRTKEAPVRLCFIDLKMNGGYGAKRTVNACRPGTCSELMKAAAQPERFCPAMNLQVRLFRRSKGPDSAFLSAVVWDNRPMR